MTKYILRLDDSSHYQDPFKWRMLEKGLVKYDIKPIVGVIPSNEDPSMVYYEKD